MNEPRQTFRVFETRQAARDYRHEHGTGGWIFAPDNGADCVLFPPDMSPSHIINHPLTRGLDGALLGSQ